jgi:ribosome-binding protein aMBF1 (putative translation factor)
MATDSEVTAEYQAVPQEVKEPKAPAKKKAAKKVPKTKAKTKPAAKSTKSKPVKKVAKKSPPKAKTKAKLAAKNKAPSSKKKAKAEKPTRPAKADRVRSPVGHYLVTRRDELGITVRELSETLGLTPQAVSAWENIARIVVPMKRLPALAKALETTPEALQALVIQQVNEAAAAKEKSS